MFYHLNDQPKFLSDWFVFREVVRALRLPRSSVSPVRETGCIGKSRPQIIEVTLFALEGGTVIFNLLSLLHRFLFTKINLTKDIAFLCGLIKPLVASNVCDNFGSSRYLSNSTTQPYQEFCELLSLVVRNL